LKELQKSWDLNYWVLEIFFHCLDESTAEYLQLSEEKTPKRGSTPTRQSTRTAQSLLDFSDISNNTPSSAELSTEQQDIAGPQMQSGEEQPQQQQQQQQQPVWSENPSQPLPFSPPTSSNEIGEGEGDMSIDLSEPFLFEEEFARNFGSCAPRLDSLNSQNLEFLYRFL
jgi:hypothetical protein